MRKNRRTGMDRRVTQSDGATVERRGGPERRALLRDPDITIGRLRLLPLFRDLSMTQYTMLLRICAKTEVDRGETICRAGERVDTLFILVTGMIRVREPDGGEFTRSSPREVIGKTGFFTENTYGVTVLAESDCTLLSMSREELERVLDADGELRVQVLTNLIAQLAEQARENASVIRSLANANSMDRL